MRVYYMHFVFYKYFCCLRVIDGTFPKTVNAKYVQVTKKLRLKEIIVQVRALFAFLLVYILRYTPPIFLILFRTWEPCHKSYI